MGRAVAKIGDTIIAEAAEWETVEGNIYFPPSSIKDQDLLAPSSTTTNCYWKGTAHYYNVMVDGKEVKDAAWYYPEPKEKAVNIKDYLAFYKSKVDVQSL